MSDKITKKMIDEAHKRFFDFDMCPVNVVPQPTRTYELGEEVRVGNLQDVVVKEILEDGKAYRLEYVSTEKNRSRTAEVRTHGTGIWWWFDIEKVSPKPTAEPMFLPWLPGQVITTSLDCLLFKMAHGGLVCDPRYQRGYVWSIQDQQNLIESIFNRIQIGTFIFSRHSGYLHEKSKESDLFINLDGDQVMVPRKSNYVSAIIDGQQRLTTLWRFTTNQFKFRGLLWNELAFRDRHDFMTTMISARTFNEDDVSYRDVLQMFLHTNMGVSQDPVHLERVRRELEELGDE